MTSNHEQQQEGKAPIPKPTGPSFTRRIAGLVSGAVAFAVILLLDAPEGMTPEAKRVAATVVLMGCWWIGESLPLGVTAVIPLVAYPLLGVMSSKAVAPNYANHFELAYARSWHVYEYLTQKKGIDPQRLRLSVAGPYEPMHLSSDPVAIRENPRVEVFMLDEVVSDLMGTKQEQDKRYTDGDLP